MADVETDLDQALTTAGAAMSFAWQNYDAFRQFCTEHFSLCPVAPRTILAQATMLLELADPERMPSG